MLHHIQYKPVDITGIAWSARSHEPVCQELLCVEWHIVGVQVVHVALQNVTLTQLTGSLHTMDSRLNISATPHVLMGML